MTGFGARNPRKTYVLAFVLIASLFAVWGLAHRLYDTLFPEFAKALALNGFKADLAQSVLCLGYCLLAIPAGLLTRSFGYKTGVVCGLCCLAVGTFLFYPAADQHEYFFFLFAVLVIGSGLAILETSANPMVARLGPVESSVRRLNWAQALNPVGLLLGAYISRWLIQSKMQLPVGELAHAMVRPYIVIGVGVLFMAVLVDNVEFPPVANERAAKGARGVGEFRTLLSRPLFMFGVAAQFFCATAQVGLWSFTIRYVQNAMPGNLVTSAADILLWSLFAFTVGRFVGAALMYWIDPDRLLAVYAGVSAVLTAIAALAGGGYGVTCVAATSFFLSIMFPTIFAGSIRDLGTLTKSGAAFLVMAAGGGVAALAIMNLVWGLSSIQYVMLVPSISFAVVLAFAIANQRAAKGM